MLGLPDGEKNFEDIYNRLDSIAACGRRTDRQTDILPRHSPRYAYASRGKNVKFLLAAAVATTGVPMFLCRKKTPPPENLLLLLCVRC